MKTSRIVLFTLVAAASASASFAGPGLHYWKSRGVASAPTPVAVKKVESCVTMKSPNGKVTVKCTGAVKEGSGCKRHCAG